MFNAKFVAMKVRVETLHAIKYKLRMMGIPMSGPLYVYGDNMLIIHNTSKPESTLKKKCNVIAFHAICKSVAMRESLTGHIRSEDNLLWIMRLDDTLRLNVNLFIILQVLLPLFLLLQREFLLVQRVPLWILLVHWMLMS